MSMLVIVPSRGRPENINELRRAWWSTFTDADLLVGLDDDDPELCNYQTARVDVRRDLIEVGQHGGMAATLNWLAVKYAPSYDAIGFMGDDHRPRTRDWDKRVEMALNELGTGIVYGNDLVHGEALPTAVFMTCDIIQALGWMALPNAKHLYLDNAWLDLGQRLGAISYLPDVIIEHVHPLVGKAEWDEGYRRVNSGDLQAHDLAVYETWRAEGLERDVAKIRAACE